MTRAWNLSPQEWSQVLLTQADPEAVAAELRAGKFLPWVENLIDLTAGARDVLDLGSGKGENSAMLALSGKKTTLLDWSEENLEFAKRLYKTMGIAGNFKQADMTQRLPFEDGAFDVVFSCGVFEYFRDKEIVRILKEAFRVARKRVIILVPNAACVSYRFGKWYMETKRKWPWGGERPFYSFKGYFRSAGSGPVREFSVAARHGLDFLTMPCGRELKSILIRGFRLKSHSKPAFLRQGYLVLTAGEKVS